MGIGNNNLLINIYRIISYTKIITRKTSIPKTKVIKQPVQQPSKPAANNRAGTAIKPITPQKPLPNKQIS